MIGEEDRARLGDLAMRAIDRIIARFGDEAELEDAVLIFEVSYPDDDGDGRLTEIDSETTTHRAVVAGGMAQAYALTQLTGYLDEEVTDG